MNTHTSLATHEAAQATNMAVEALPTAADRLAGQEQQRNRLRRAAVLDRRTLRALRVSGVLRELGAHNHDVLGPDEGSPLALPDQARQLAKTLNRRLVIRHGLQSWWGSTAALKAAYCSLDLVSKGDAVLVTLNLGPKRCLRAHASTRRFLSHITDEIRHKLRQSLGRRVEFWFVAERPANGDEQLRGVMGLELHEMQRASRVLSAIAGATRPGRGVRLSPITRSLAATGFATRDVGFADLMMDGSPFMRTRDVGRRGKALYEFHRLVQRELVRCQAPLDECEAPETVVHPPANQNEPSSGVHLSGTEGTGVNG